ncbi:winged helix-turn-helix domain-containing protein [Pseudoduganella armeniaca]|uniref:OmpR/PhoB-type domain-containing protein n=1 Tax=Pseudoduganella armeniaca TaxID=2072590 RepID=A0A2R4CD11_9BURK|nr:winged helix-turn-helix domain-containing protein [Pseudoduganella armeniaca]AVR97496.1 hypothetical protein C9I28_18985 [Pseudoduganella armeniaca]
MDIRLSASAPIAFGRHAFDPWRGELRTAGARPVALGACAVRVLQALIAGAGQVLTPAQLTERAWPGRAIHPSNLRVQIGVLRRALAGDRDLIGTVPGRGYVFMGETVGRGAAQSGLVGRDALLDALQRGSASTPILTLTGPAGIGKSALAGALAQRLALPTVHLRLDELAGRDDATLASAAAAGFGLAGTATAAALAAALPARPALLVLDNYDHAIDAAARLAETLARSQPALRIVATGRQTLRVDGETVVRVPPLDVRGLDGALRLLLERGCGPWLAGAAPDPDIAGAAAHLCRRLDGVPLALVLAAAQVRAQRPFGIPAILGCLRRLADAPRDLALGAASPDCTLSARHLSLHAAAAWSAPLLPAPARQALAVLARLPGWFGLWDAVALLRVHGGGGHDPVDRLALLAAHSLLLVDTSTAPARYRVALAARAWAEG